MKYESFKKMLEEFEKEAATNGLDLVETEVTVSIDLDGLAGKDETGNRLFGIVSDWNFSFGHPDQFVLLTEFESMTDGMSLVTDKET